MAAVMPTPILILCDAPDSGTGLGRIAGDLAMLLSTMPEFRVGTMGKGGHGSKKYPWPQYTFSAADQWGESLLPKFWEDFAGDTPGIIFTVWDASRLFWFGAPGYLPADNYVKDFLVSGKFKRWGYFPIDGFGPDLKLSTLSTETIKGFDRVLAYTQFGRTVLTNTFGYQPDFIPHLIDSDTFQPRDPKVGRESLGFEPQHKVVGCVMTNQFRKDWGTWAETAALLLKKDPNYRFWAHINKIENYWSLYALLADFGLENYVKVTQPCTDKNLSFYYSACDLTIMPSLGEGFGYPIAESLACGVPCIHHDYGAGGEVLPYEWKLETGPHYRLDTLHNVYRPVLVAPEWANKIHNTLKHERRTRTEIRGLVEHLFWTNLSPVWMKWFKDGLN